MISEKILQLGKDTEVLTKINEERKENIKANLKIKSRLEKMLEEVKAYNLVASSGVQSELIYTIDRLVIENIDTQKMIDSTTETIKFLS